MKDQNETLIDLNLPPFLNEMFGHVRLIGPCNGILCLYGFPDNIALWNPSTRDFKRLPQSRGPRPHNSKVRGGDLGLGLDPKGRDLKILQMLFCVLTHNSRIVVQVEIYSLRSDSWKKFNSNVPANVMYHNLWSMVFKNETFCWWAQDRDNVEVILSFDVSREVFRTTPLPSEIEGLGGERRITRAIVPRKEALCLIVYGQRDVDKVFDVWSLRELGGSDKEGCWKKEMCIGPVSRVVKPLGFWGVGGIFLESSDGEMVFFNFVDGSIKNFGVYGKRSRLEVVVIKETLFSLRS
ncbi:hypothetical protein ACS0TY_030119 [Phlomoides rotata]